MLIGENYKIECDEMNIIVYEKRVLQAPKPNAFRPTRAENIGKEVWQAKSYFSKTNVGYHCALERVVSLCLSRDDFKDLETIVAKLDEIYALIKGMEYSSTAVRA